MRRINDFRNKRDKYTIHNLMQIITIISVLVFAIANFVNSNIYSMLALIPYKVLQGEVWRLVTFIFVTPTSLLFAIFAFYFYYLAGVELEREWGSFKFNMYYFIGMISVIIVSFLTNSVATGVFLNLSLFLAYAKLYPDTEVMVYFIIPVKIKYLGYFNWFLIILNFIKYTLNGDLGSALIVIVPVVNYLMFFARTNYREAKMRRSSVIRLKDYRKKMESVKKEYRHKCEVCGITDVDDPSMEFRYCSKCTGKKGYCEKHIRNHEHK